MAPSMNEDDDSVMMTMDDSSNADAALPKIQPLEFKKSDNPFTSLQPFEKIFRRDMERQLSLFEKDGVPLTPEGTAPINNHLARSPLFSPIKRGKRKYLRGATLASQEGVTLKYYGEQLDMSDQNVLLHAYHLAAGIAPGEDISGDGESTPLIQQKSRIVINRAQFLKNISMTNTGKNYEWLHGAFIRLATCLIELDTKEYRSTYNLIGPPAFDKRTEEYYIYIPRSAFAFFGNSTFGYVNMERRLALPKDKHRHLASWIQSFVVTHDKEKPHTFSLKYLKKLCGQTQPMRHFRVAFKIAVAELLKAGEFESADVDEKDMFTFKRVKK